MHGFEGFAWTDEPRFPRETLERFAAEMFAAAGLVDEDAVKAAESLVLADLRGIETHGVQRMRFYLQGLAGGGTNPRAELSVERESPSTIALNGNRGLGLVMARRGMERVIAKAAESGICLGTLRNSSHFGIAGAYALMAAAQDMCGMAMTNTGALVAPMFGKQKALGTNPIAFAAPTSGDPFCLDMSTSTVAVGKIEVARRLGIPLPQGWGLDIHGSPNTDPNQHFTLTPLGGSRITSGHKGYGLGLMVEIFCGQLAGNAWSLNVGRSHASGDGGDNGHMLMAWRVDAFRDIDEFKAEMDDMAATLRGMEPSDEYPNQTVLIPGDPEVFATRENERLGVPVRHSVLAELNEDATALGVAPLIP